MENLKFPKDNIESVPEGFCSSDTNLSLLIFLPDHIIDKIVSHVDTYDMMSLSQCCTRLNEVLKRQKDLQNMNNSLKIKRSIKSSSALEAVFRVFTSSNVTKLHVTELEDVNFSMTKLLKLLTYYGKNLTHLELNFRHEFSQMELFKRSWNPLNRFQRINMSKLTHLIIDYELFVFLNEVYIDFDSMTKLQYIAFVYHDNSAEEKQLLIASSSQRNLEIISKIRKFLKIQTDLKTLILIGGLIAKIFDEPLNVKFMLLEQFYLYKAPNYENTLLDPSDSSRFLNDVQQNHLCTFVTSQVQLKEFYIFFFVSDKTPESVHLMREDLEKQSISKYICIFENVPFQWIAFDIHFADDFLETVGDFQPNMTTRNLKLKIFRSNPDSLIMALILPLVVQKFPNVKSLDLTLALAHNESEHFNISCLGNLSSLKKLDFNSRHSKCFNNVSIPSLESLIFSLCENNLESIKTFIIRHHQIGELGIHISVESNFETLIREIIAFALEKMSRLKSITLCFSCSSFDHDCTHYKIEFIDKQKLDIVQKMIIALIRKFADKGFVLDSNMIDGYMYMKRFDNEVVMRTPKSNRWQVIEF